jgi:hypothetical protein
MPGGRPTDYNPEWVETLPDMFTEGQSVLEVAVKLGITKTTYYAYEKQYPEFLAASTRGKEISQQWWESKGRENLFDIQEYDAENKISTSKKFNDRLWSRNMAARFREDWTEKQQVEVSGNITLNIDNDDNSL